MNVYCDLTPLIAPCQTERLRLYCAERSRPLVAKKAFSSFCRRPPGRRCGMLSVSLHKIWFLCSAVSIRLRWDVDSCGLVHSLGRVPRRFCVRLLFGAVEGGKRDFAVKVSVTGGKSVLPVLDNGRAQLKGKASFCDSRRLNGCQLEMATA